MENTTPSVRNIRIIIRGVNNTILVLRKKTDNYQVYQLPGGAINDNEKRLSIYA